MTMYDSEFLNRLQAMLRSALPTWSLAPDSDLSLLTISENATFRVWDEAAGRQLILRAYRPDYHTTEEILSELTWISALRADRVAAIPAPVPGCDG